MPHAGRAVSRPLHSAPCGTHAAVFGSGRNKCTTRSSGPLRLLERRACRARRRDAVPPLHVVAPQVLHRPNVAGHKGCKVFARVAYAALHGAYRASGGEGGVLIAESRHADEKECLTVRVGQSAKPCAEILGNAPANLIRWYGRCLGVYLIYALARSPQLSALVVEAVAEDRDQPSLEV